MSVKAPEVNEERVQRAKSNQLLRTGRCVVCQCDRFEFHVRQDGYDTCVCQHTQWGHLDPVSSEAFDLKQKKDAESKAALAKEVQ